MRTALTPRARHSASERSQSWRSQPAKRARVCVRLTCVVAAAASQLQWTRQSSIVLLTEQVDIVLNLREVLACCCFCCCAVLLLYSRLCRGVCRLRGGRCRSAVKRLHRLASHRCTGHFGMSLATYESTTHHPHQGGKPLGRGHSPSGARSVACALPSIHRQASERHDSTAQKPSRGQHVRLISGLAGVPQQWVSGGEMRSAADPRAGWQALAHATPRTHGAVLRHSIVDVVCLQLRRRQPALGLQLPLLCRPSSPESRMKC